jgi:hypothetical protein
MVCGALVLYSLLRVGGHCHAAYRVGELRTGSVGVGMLLRKRVVPMNSFTGVRVLLRLLIHV